MDLLERQVPLVWLDLWVPVDNLEHLDSLALLVYQGHQDSLEARDCPVRLEPLDRQVPKVRRDR